MSKGATPEVIQEEHRLLEDYYLAAKRFWLAERTGSAYPEYEAASEREHEAHTELLAAIATRLGDEPWWI